MVKKKVLYTWTGILFYFEKDIGGQDIEIYETFVLPFDNTNLNLSIRDESVTQNKEEKNSEWWWIRT